MENQQQDQPTCWQQDLRKCEKEIEKIQEKVETLQEKIAQLKREHDFYLYKLYKNKENTDNNWLQHVLET